MNFRSNDYEADINLYLVKRFVKQYLDSKLTDEQFRVLCHEQIEEIINRDLESEGFQAQLHYRLIKAMNLLSQQDKKYIIQNISLRAKPEGLIKSFFRGLGRITFLLGFILISLLLLFTLLAVGIGLWGGLTTL